MRLGEDLIMTVILNENKEIFQLKTLVSSLENLCSKYDFEIANLYDLVWSLHSKLDSQISRISDTQIQSTPISSQEIKARQKADFTSKRFEESPEICECLEDISRYQIPEDSCETDSEYIEMEASAFYTPPPQHLPDPSPALSDDDSFPSIKNPTPSKQTRVQAFSVSLQAMSEEPSRLSSTSQQENEHPNLRKQTRLMNQLQDQCRDGQDAGSGFGGSRVRSHGVGKNATTTNQGYYFS
mmetsp:Transcript_26118/g.30160  ORF Transcript_26118/g.30160 Transcript_26118/m.30160 type:complete len:240 (+) Transcript_26118:55-774(+)